MAAQPPTGPVPAHATWKLLAVETADRWGSVAAAVADADRREPRVTLLRDAPLPRDRRSAQTLAPAIERLLDACGWRLAELDAVAVAVGPGSFTGLRVGVTTAKSVAWATGSRLVAVGTLDALVEPHLANASRVWGVLDAQRGEVFAACFDSGEASAAVSRVDRAGLLARLEARDRVVGPIAPSLAEEFAANGGVSADVEFREADPTAAAVARLGAAKLAAGVTVDPMQLVPDYHRRSAAEENLVARREP